MSGAATHSLATSVTLNGGLGFIGFTGLPSIMDRELRTACQIFTSSGTPVSTDPLPIGIGIIAISGHPQAWSSIFALHKPAVVWLSFGTADQFSEWTRAIRAASASTKIWIQLGSVSAALEAAAACNPDALVLQGVDAGGHGHKDGASVVTLVPEVADALQEHDFSSIALLAAGGIMDGRGIAAAIALGADGVVMGTRFLGAEECALEPNVRREVFAAVDGGQSTVGSRIWDEVWGQSSWPEAYDGRCLRNTISDDSLELLF
ncbi:unnamed protein product [Alternaria alternata]